MKAVSLLVFACVFLACMQSQSESNAGPDKVNPDSKIIQSNVPSNVQGKETKVSPTASHQQSDTNKRENQNNSESDPISSKDSEGKPGSVQKTVEITSSPDDDKIDETEPKAHVKVDTGSNDLNQTNDTQILSLQLQSTPIAPSHTAFNQLLQKYVSASGNVSYSGLKKERDKLELYLQEMSKVDPGLIHSKAGKMAFWINVYNAATLNLILVNYPLESITDLDNGQTWKIKRIRIGERQLSLDEIENEILRPQFKDARIHFAVNCAAKSCPPLSNEAFTEENLESLLEQLTKRFINDDSYNTLGTSAVVVSKIFDWYKVDFGDDLVKYLNHYSNILIEPNAEVKFKEYDWGLNGQ